MTEQRLAPAPDGCAAGEGRRRWGFGHRIEAVERTEAASSAVPPLTFATLGVSKESNLED